MCIYGARLFSKAYNRLKFRGLVSVLVWGGVWFNPESTGVYVAGGGATCWDCRLLDWVGSLGLIPAFLPFQSEEPAY